MNLHEAAAKGISRIRRPMWSKNTYAKIDLLPGGSIGPWMRLYDRQCQEAIQEQTPQSTICIGDSTDDYEPYEGEVDPADSPPPPRPICHGFITRDDISYIFEIYSAHDDNPEDFAIYTERQDGSKGQSVNPDPFLTDIQLAYQAHIDNESLRD